ncbi:hypothetical protein E3T28_07095 [Cryobacterium sinapicolor]|uniref:Uncharacterized protein n=1 Tax=Cryobacterium sinapicolor TaxID=1259236 RepID=A0ABY2J8N3_9MICO|nr:hypothetical protein [Cryobacterium sinapicolor]TFD01315.1 hypothetical protein E3T28_07095 [Cryobacterium sinapicolor]
MDDAHETAPDHSWLPPHQEHVAYTLAHVDQLIAQVGKLLWGYMDREVFTFDTLPHPRGSAVTITKVQPFPEGIARVFADATTQLRAAIEHTIFAEVEHSLGRDLSPEEAQTIEMPARLTEESFTSWLGHSKRKLIPAFAPGAALSTRVSRLQPFHDVDPTVHPMRLLAEYTNFAKHRAPAITTVRVGPVMPDRDVPGVQVVEFDEPVPARVGDVLVHGPRRAKVGVSIYPFIASQRPHTGTWHVLMKELGELADWVRTVAIPTLVTGDATVDPLIPGIDISVGHGSLEDALTGARRETAFVLNQTRVIARGIRGDLAESLTQTSRGTLSLEDAKRWLDGLGDAEVIRRLDEVGFSSTPAKALRAYKILKGHVREARASVALDDEEDELTNP